MIGPAICLTIFAGLFGGLLFTGAFALMAVTLGGACPALWPLFLKTAGASAALMLLNIFEDDIERHAKAVWTKWRSQ